jgi:ribonuclease-3
MPRRSPLSGRRSTTWSPTPPDAVPLSPLAGLLAQLGSARRRQVLTHRSWVNERVASYERLEFLGDSVLQLVVTEELMRRHPMASEGDLAWMRQTVVDGEMCARVAIAEGLPGHLRAIAPEHSRGLADQPSVQGALTEAVIGAAWLDLGIAATADAVRAAFADAIVSAVPGQRDPKTTLQELAAREGLAVQYEIAQIEGPAHRRAFTTRVTVGTAVAEGRGGSKQSSERAAAAAVLVVIAGGA